MWKTSLKVCRVDKLTMGLAGELATTWTFFYLSLSERRVAANLKTNGGRIFSAALNDILVGW